MPSSRASDCALTCLDDIEEIQGHVAAEANHTRDPKQRQRLDKLFERFQKFLSRYEDQG
ncbi:hypothetical protein BH20ACI3_BH20ACI3_34860 [soil metagenome]